MADYYFEFADQIVEAYALKGNILLLKGEELELRKKFAATRIWREASDGSVYWVKNREHALTSGLRLTKKELDEFVWIKLRAII